MTVVIISVVEVLLPGMKGKKTRLEHVRLDLVVENIPECMVAWCKISHAETGKSTSWTFASFSRNSDSPFF